jgi:hypothetical protein
MLELPAESLLTLMHGIDFIATGCDKIAEDPSNEELRVGLEKLLKANLLLVNAHAILLGLDVAGAWASRLVKELRGTFDHLRAKSEIDKIRDAVRTGLANKLFMYIPSNRFSYYSEANLFGDEVENKLSSLSLSSVSADIAEAGRCFALDRWTATVFHLMRVLETGVREFGRMLGVDLSRRHLWNEILLDADGQIQAMPRGERREACQQIHAALHAVRVAWRNPTMHGVERTYVEPEAEQIWNCSKAFMQALAPLL